MRKTILIFLLAAILALLLTGMAFATHKGEPVGGCPDGFELHHIGDHDHDEHPHRHVGIDTDKNGDGYICVKHAGGDGSIHIHTDNNEPLN
jgi:hypothetical protein